MTTTGVDSQDRTHADQDVYSKWQYKYHKDVRKRQSKFTSISCRLQLKCVTADMQRTSKIPQRRLAGGNKITPLMSLQRAMKVPHCSAKGAHSTPLLFFKGCSMYPTASLQRVLNVPHCCSAKGTQSAPLLFCNW